MRLVAVKLSKDDPELIAALNEDYHNGDSVIIKAPDLTIDELPDSFEYLMIDAGEYMIKICSPVST